MKAIKKRFQAGIEKTMTHCRIQSDTGTDNKSPVPQYIISIGYHTIIYLTVIARIQDSSETANRRALQFKTPGQIAPCTRRNIPKCNEVGKIYSIQYLIHRPVSADYHYYSGFRTFF